ncbi:polysaccharide deacetylase family protein [Rhodococcus ruber]|uniref:polysaccharide deacetylase family protein n=1 Tax=Rhodococcus ruber TaxID=1830 RepID=UPI000661865C|nr:polysaccharide deacetylase family protein [Rhodococcus ruber]
MARKLVSFDEATGKLSPDVETALGNGFATKGEVGAKLDQTAVDARVRAVGDATYVRSVNGSAPDAAGNVAVAAGGALSISPRSPAPPVSNFVAPANQAGHGWIATGTGITAEPNDTTDAVVGSQSFRYTTDGTGSTSFGIDKTIAAPVDVTGKYLRMWLKIDNYARLGQVSIWLGSGGLTNRRSGEPFVGSLGEKASALKGGEWVTIDMAITDFAASSGAPDLTQINTFRLRAYDNGTGPLTVRFGGFALVDPPAAATGGVVTLTFDDSSASAYSIARPYMDKYGYAGVLFPILEQVGNPDRITVDQIRALQNYNGWEIGAHANTSAQHALGMAGRTEADMRAELTTIKDWYTARGFAPTSYAYPIGEYDALGERIVAEYFRAARGNATKFVETLPPSMPYRIRAVSVGPATPVATVSALVDRAVAGKGWVVVVFHGIQESAPSSPNTLTSTFQGIVDYIATSGAKVRTMQQVLAMV